MGNVIDTIMSALPESVRIVDVDVPFGLFVFVMAVILISACCCLKCCKSKKPVTGEKFKWPSSSRFLKKADPAHPHPLIVNKYQDPIRTDVLPEDEETFWIVRYTPNGERSEVKHQMYLRFKQGAVYGIGFEEARKLCKISGKYKHNRRANQTALYLECKFSNDCDTVLFHGTGNGTGIIGNCYVREINPFFTLSSVPGVRRMDSEKYKGSFLMLKQLGMGESSLRARLHTRRVHKWAGKCFPDDSAPLPTSPMHSPGSRPSYTTGSGYVPITAMGLSDSSRSAGRSRTQLAASSQGGKSKKFRGFFRRKRPSVEIAQSRPAAGAKAGAAGGVPPWVRQGSDTGIEHGDDDYMEAPAPPAATRGPRRLNTGNYLEVDGIPGKSGTGDLV